MTSFAPEAALLRAAAKKYERDMIRFARELIAIPSLTGKEGKAVARVREEMLKAGFDAVRIDRMGNLIGRLGRGKTQILFDAHLDTVSAGERRDWRWDPFKGKLEGGEIFGRGATDQKLAVVSIVYAARLIRDLALLGDYTFWAVASVMEEDCEGLPLLHVIQKEKLRPDYVVITEPSNLVLRRGQRGRTELAWSSGAAPATPRPRAGDQRRGQHVRDHPGSDGAQRPPRRRSLPGQGERGRDPGRVEGAVSQRRAG